MSALLQLDMNVLRWINVSLAHPVLTDFMMFITDKHNWYPIIAAAAVLLLVAGRKLPHDGNFFHRKNPRVYLFGLILCVLLSDQTGSFLKHNVERIRPNRAPVVSRQLYCPLHTAGRRSFPSNHAANAGSIAVFTAFFYPPLALPACGVALLVGLSRVYLAVHYPSDVLAGWLIGALTGWLVWKCLRKRSFATGVTGFANMFRFRQYQKTTPPPEGWETVSWVSNDGHNVKGWLLPGSENLIVFIHGLGGTALSRVKLAQQIRELDGSSFLLVPLRGSDGHPVWPVTGGVDEAHDVLGALKFSKDRGYSPDNTILYGTSMGGASSLKACALAGNLLPHGLILHGVFAGFFDSAENRLSGPGTWLLRLLMPSSSVRELDEFDPCFWAGLISRGCTVEYIYGARDRTSPADSGRRIEKSCSAYTGGFTILGNRGHPTGRNTSDDEFAEILSTVVRRIRSDRKR